MKKQVIGISILLMSLLCVFIVPAAIAEAATWGSWLPVAIVGDNDTAIWTDNTTSDSFDLGRDYQYMNIIVPTINTGNITFMASRTSNGTYYQLGESPVTITAGAGEFYDTVNIEGARWLKIVLSSNQTDARLFYVRGWSIY